MIRRSISRLNGGDYGLALAQFHEGACLAFPGDNTWANQFRATSKGRGAYPTHRGRVEIEAFLRRYVKTGIQMEVDDILVDGGPWRTRVAVRAHHWIPGTDKDIYNNRAVLFVESSWGRIRAQEDYADTERMSALDEWLAGRGVGRR